MSVLVTFCRKCLVFLFLQRWKAKLEEPKSAGTNQGPFNQVVTQMEREDKLRVRLLLNRVFPVGKRYRDFGRRHELTDSGTPLNMTMETNVTLPPLPLDGVAFHNNFCSQYKNCKIDRARALGVWVDLDSATLL